MAEDEGKEVKQEPKVGEPKIERGEVAPDQMEELEKGEYVTIAQIATELCYTRAWILKLVQDGRIKGIKPLGGRWRIPRSEHDRIIKEGIPPMPREPAEKPPVTEIEVSDKKVIDKVKEPLKQGQKSEGLFLDFFGTFQRK